MSEVRALLLTDVVDSTKLSEALGDARMAEVWAAHDRVARDLLPAHHGLEIDKTDGFLMLFESAADAVAYAIAYHRAIGGIEPPLKARAGLHVGPVILRHNDPKDVARGAKPLEVDGLAKPTAARVMSLASGGQTLLTPSALDALGSTMLRVESHGHWRMKGVSEPIELFEVGEPDAPFTPPPASSKVYRVVRSEDRWLPVHEVPHNLPAERDRFIGRQAELLELSRRLDEGARLVSILGPGGSGKTRLALRYGWTWLGDWPGGIAFADLSEATDPEAIATAVARALDVPVGKGDPGAVVGEAIASRGRCLIVLDTLEHLVEHTAIPSQWLDRAPEASFVITTRELLGIRGEQPLHLDPLDRDDALALFAARAEAVRPGFSLADHRAACTALVELLDHLPLAIELAASRVRVLPPEKLLDRMSRRFELLAGSGRDRQSTLRATLDWSWDLLDDAERAALAQLSVFEEGFTLPAAEAVLELPGGVWGMDAVQALVDKSLVRTTGDRFDLLRSVREYAAARLVEQDGVARAHLRHGDVFAELSEDQRTAELANLVVACERATATGREDVAVATLRGAWDVLHRIGPFSVGIRLAVGVLGLCTDPQNHASALDISGHAAHLAGHVDRALELTWAALDAFEALGDRRRAGRLRGRIGAMLVEQGRWDDAVAHLERALEQLADDPAGQALARSHLGVAWSTRDPDKTIAHYTAAIELAQKAGETRTIVTSTANLAGVHYRLGEYEEARQLLKQGLASAREAGDLRVEGHLLSNLGAIYLEMGRPERARKRFAAALSIHRRLGNRRGVGTVLGKLAWLLHQQGKLDEALPYYAAAIEVSREVRNKPSQAIAHTNLGQLLLEQKQYRDARVELETGRDLNRQVHSAVYEAHAVGALGRLAVAEGRRDEGRALLEEALALHRQGGNPRYEAKTLIDLGALHIVEGRLGVARMALEIAEGVLRDTAFEAEKTNLARVMEALEAREA